MTDAQLKHDQPNLTGPQAILAHLAEALEMARHVEASLQAAKTATGATLADLVRDAGLPEELEAAGQTMRDAIKHDLDQLTEQELELGRNAGLLTPDDFRDALKTKRTFELARGHSSGREEERGI